MTENKNNRTRREFLKNIFRATVFSGLIGVGFIATKKKDGASSTIGICSQQRCGKCSQLANCKLPDAESFKEATEKDKQQINVKTGNTK